MYRSSFRRFASEDPERWKRTWRRSLHPRISFRSLCRMFCRVDRSRVTFKSVHLCYVYKLSCEIGTLYTFARRDANTPNESRSNETSEFRCTRISPSLPFDFVISGAADDLTFFSRRDERERERGGSRRRSNTFPTLSERGRVARYLIRRGGGVNSHSTPSSPSSALLLRLRPLQTRFLLSLSLGLFASSSLFSRSRFLLSRATVHHRA